MNAGPVGYHNAGCPGAHPPYPVMRCACWRDNFNAGKTNIHPNIVPERSYCKLSFPPERRDEVVDTNVGRIMNMTRPPTRSEVTEIIEAVFNAVVTSVVHQRGE